MASQGGSQRNVHQDYIVRQRYSNGLPPPAGAPKLLEIPHPGLEQYTVPHYASRLARSQPLNIEADGMLGMPIDLVGMPGVFDGDESSIQAPLVPPPVHPRDRSLLRPLKSLGKPKTEVNDISFLRRTQYTAEDRGRFESSSRNPTGQARKRKADITKDDPMNILRAVIKGFDIANPETVYRGPDLPEKIQGLVPTAAELDAWKNPKHPTNPNLTVVDSYPVLPNLDAAPDDHGYAVYKFNGNPTDNTIGPDARMENALLRPMGLAPEAEAIYHAKVAAHKADPVNVADPGLPPEPFQLFLPADVETALNFKRRFDVDDVDKEDMGLYTHKSEGGGEPEFFKYSHARIYDPGAMVDLRGKANQEFVVALYDNDPDEDTFGSRLQKAAYWDPVTFRFQFKPRRAMQLAELGLAGKVEEEQEIVDVAEVQVVEPTDEEQERRGAYKALLDTKEEA